MTTDEILRFSAIADWVFYVLRGRANPWEAAEAIEGLAARIRADHSPQGTPVRTRIGAENETGRAAHHTPPAMAEPSTEVRRV